LGLRGDEGARYLLRKHQVELHLVACEDSGIIRDIDQLEDLPGWVRL